MKFFIVGNRHGQKVFELYSAKPYSTLEEAQAVAAKIPTTWNAIILNTTEEKDDEPSNN